MLVSLRPAPVALLATDTVFYLFSDNVSLSLTLRAGSVIAKRPLSDVHHNPRPKAVRMRSLNLAWDSAVFEDV